MTHTNSERELLEEIRDLLGRKENISIILTSRETSWTTIFSPALYLDPKKQFEIALVDLETFYSIPNITQSNRLLEYTKGNEKHRIHFPIGSYEITDIDKYIQRELKLRNHVDSGIKLSVNSATLRAAFHIENPEYKIDMSESTIRTLLGFRPRVLRESYNEGDIVVNILRVNSILVKCSIIGGSYRNGTASNVLYDFFPNCSPGEKIIQTPHNLVYLPVTSSGLVGQIEIKLVDQDENSIDLRGEVVTLRLHLRSM